MGKFDFFFPCIAILYISLCVIGLAATHVAFKEEGGITAIDFNVGKSDRSGVKVTGKRKKVISLSLSLSGLVACRICLKIKIEE